MNYGVTTQDYRTLITQADSIDVIIRQLKDSANWHPDENSHPLSNSGPRQNISKAVELLQSARSTYRDHLALCIPRAEFSESSATPGAHSSPTISACNELLRTVQTVARREFDRLREDAESS